MRETNITKYRGITDLEFVEGYIERLNRQITNLPTEHRVRFLPCKHCGQLFMEINFEGTMPLWEHQGSDCEDLVRQGVLPSAWQKSIIDDTEPLFEMTCIETGKVIEWEKEDIEYAQTCEREKWLSRGY